ncbi:MAG: tetratricopeptide repeat protein [Candidatus Eremiobacteraeota bacterium]|nr:tetratricopeptide repeat protein [Candidatus Eremiobacteraeota bacterium]
MSEKSLQKIEFRRKPIRVPFSGRFGKFMLAAILAHVIILYSLYFITKKYDTVLRIIPVKLITGKSVEEIPDIPDNPTSEGPEGRTHRAISEYTELIKNDPKNISLYSDRGTMYARMGRLEDAETDFRKIKRMYPEKPEGYHGMAMVHAKRRKFREAMDNIQTAIKMMPDNPQYLADRGFVRIHIHKFGEAKEDMKKALEIDPLNPYANMGMGEVHRMEDNLEKGAKYYEKAIALDPTIPKSNLRLAAIYFDMDRFGEAIEQYKFELDKIQKFGRVDDFHEGAVYSEMARTYAMLDDMENAKIYLEKFYESVDMLDVFEAESREALYLLSDLGNAYIEMGAHEPKYYKDALKAYKACLDHEERWINVSNLYHNFQVGWCYWETGKKNEAMKYFKKALTYKPERETRYELWMQGHILTLLGRYDEAIEKLNRSLELDPTFENPFYSRGLAYYKMGKKEKALFDLNMVTKLRKEKNAIAIFNRKAEKLKKMIGGD